MKRQRFVLGPYVLFHVRDAVFRIYHEDELDEELVPSDRDQEIVTDDRDRKIASNDRKRRPKPRSEAELRTELEFRTPIEKPSFLVAPTSIASNNDAGFGLYACRGFDAGMVVLDYPGERCNYEQYESLNQYLALCECDVLLLQQRYKITIVNRPPHGKRKPNWHAIYDSFIEYVFSGGDDLYVYWNIYDWTTGKIVANHLKDFGLFVNEPCPFDAFFNTQSHCNQLSVPNVYAQASKDGRSLQFVAKKKIKAGDEILIFYGGFYPRAYKINYSHESCGDWRLISHLVQFEDTDSYDCHVKKDVKLDKQSKELFDDYLLNVKNYKSQGKVFNRTM